VAALADALPRCPTLSALNLAHNRLGLRAASMLSRGLARRAGALDINLDGNPIGRHVPHPSRALAHVTSACARSPCQRILPGAHTRIRALSVRALSAHAPLAHVY
jgi:hypothetical protein